MSDSYGDPQQKNRRFEGNRDDSRGGFRGGRNPGGREGGGFRIRLSDNEMRAARSLQEAFNLRSTVAVLGFAIRTLAQMLEEGKLEALINQSRSQGTHHREEPRQGSRKNRSEGEKQSFNRGTPKPNPFARPEKPQPIQSEKVEDEPDPSLDKQQPELSNNSDNDITNIETNSSEEIQDTDNENTSSNDEQLNQSNES